MRGRLGVDMRSCSDRARALIEAPADEFGGGFDVTWVVDLIYDNERRLANLPVSEVELSWDGSSFVQGSGSVRVVWADDFGSSMIPRELGDWFSPFGAELQVDVLVSAGSFVERIPMGRGVIDESPDAVEASMVYGGRRINPGESFTVSLKDRLVKVARDEFPFPTAPSSTSAWYEVQSITGFPVVRNVPDAVVSTSIAYEGEKRDALNKLFDLMESWPQLNPSGVLTALPKAWGAPVAEIRGVVSASVSMSSAETYNTVVVEGKDADGEPIFATADVLEGFLRVRNVDGSVSPFGRKPYRYASEFLRTYEQCVDYARNLLARVSRVRGVTREVEEPFNPLREVGDVLAFEGGVVRVRKVSHQGGVTRLLVEVPDGGS